ncbi:MAG: alpha/beta fold hydrolase [Actinomycetota bacterium]
MNTGAALESPVFFPSASPEGEALFGIFTAPAGRSNGTGVILLAGGGHPSPGRNSNWVKLTRKLGQLGYHSLRFDYHGVGESAGRLERLHLARPFVDDLEGAVRWLVGRGVNDIVLLGTCFGARTALAGAARITDLRGIAMLAGPIRDFEMGDPTHLPLSAYAKLAVNRVGIKKLLDRQKRAEYVRFARTKGRAAWDRTWQRVTQRDGAARIEPSANYHSALQGLVERSVPTLIAFGAEEAFFYEFQKARSGKLGRLLNRGGGRIEVVATPCPLHGFTSVEAQETAEGLFLGWLARLPPLRGERTPVGAQQA